MERMRGAPRPTVSSGRSLLFSANKVGDRAIKSETTVRQGAFSKCATKASRQARSSQTGARSGANGAAQSHRGGRVPAGAQSEEGCRGAPSQDPRQSAIAVAVR